VEFPIEIKWKLQSINFWLCKPRTIVVNLELSFQQNSEMVRNQLRSGYTQTAAVVTLTTC